MRATIRRSLGGALVGLVLLGLSASAAEAFPNWLTDFTTRYGNTGTQAAACQVCHVQPGGGNNFNPYGNALLATALGPAAAFAAVEGQNSDGAAGLNLAEIQAGAQPGWCVVGTPGCNNGGSTPPGGVLLDPVSGNQPPVANAGPAQSVNVGATVMLDGTASSDPDGGLLTYSWTFLTRPAGSTASLTNPTTVHPTFVADASGSYTLQLVVNDGTANSAPATVTIAAAPAQNLPPTANAGAAQTVTVGQTVTLSGSGSSDPDGNPLTYSWSLVSRPAGSAATLTGATTVGPTFVADAAGQFVVQLVVNDGTANSAPATVTITTASAANRPPTANAGPAQTVNVGATVTLSGSGSSDPDGNPLTYAWSFVSVPAGSAATLTGATTVGPTFVADAAGQFVVQLVVNDGTVSSAPTTVVIGAAVVNQPPTANAGPAQTVAVGATVTLDGSGSSDPNGNPLTYSWSFVSRPAGSAAALANPTGLHPTFVADVAGQYVVGLVVNDGTVNSLNTANVVITTASATENKRPIANAGPAQTLNAGVTVTLDGSGSSDPNGDPLTYSWSFVSRPSGSAATLANPTDVHPTFVADVAGRYRVRLIVRDGVKSSAPATVTITALEVPGPADLSIVTFKATEQVRLGRNQSVRFRVVVRDAKRTGLTIPGGVPATLVGVQNGAEVYRQVVTASTPPRRAVALTFPPYTPTAMGRITWTLTIEDSGPAHNSATEKTKVKGPKGEEPQEDD
jgi:hypothetical protein